MEYFLISCVMPNHRATRTPMVERKLLIVQFSIMCLFTLDNPISCNSAVLARGSARGSPHGFGVTTGRNRSTQRKLAKLGGVKLDHTLLTCDQGNFNQITTRLWNRTLVTVVRDTCTTTVLPVPSPLLYRRLGELLCSFLMELVRKLLVVLVRRFADLSVSFQKRSLENWSFLGIFTQGKFKIFDLAHFQALSTTEGSNFWSGPLSTFATLSLVIMVTFAKVL